MTSLGTTHLATVAKDEKQGFQTFNQLEISRVRQVRYADYENLNLKNWKPKDRPRPRPTPRKIQSRQIDIKIGTIRYNWLRNSNITVTKSKTHRIDHTPAPSIEK